MMFEKQWYDLKDKSGYKLLRVRDINKSLEDMEQKKLKVLFDRAIDCKKEYNTWNIWECVACTGDKCYDRYDRKQFRDHFLSTHWNIQHYIGKLEEVQENELQEITLKGEDSDLSFEIELHSSTPFFSWISQNQRYQATFNSWEPMKGKIENKYNSIVSKLKTANLQFTGPNIQADIAYLRERVREVEEALKLDLYRLIIEPIVKFFLWEKFYNTLSLDTVLDENEAKKKKKNKKKKKSSQVSVAEAAEEALSTDMDEHPDSIQLLSELFAQYIQDAGLGEDNIDGGWLGRQGIAVELHNVADVLRKEDLPIVMTFLISHALADPNTGVRGRMISAGIKIIDNHGKDNFSLLFPIFEDFLNKKALDEEKCNLVREGVVMFLGALAQKLEMNDPKVHTVVEKFLDVINTPPEAVQRAVSTCLSPLMQSMQNEAPTLVSKLLDQLTKSDKYGERRGAAFGLAGVVKGFGISCLKKYEIVITLREAFADRNSEKCREGALMAFECLCENLGILFEPYVIQMLPSLLVSFSDRAIVVRDAAVRAAHAMMSLLSTEGVKLVLPSLLKGIEQKDWQTKQSNLQLLGEMADHAPEVLSQYVHVIVPQLTEVLTYNHPKVRSAGQIALQRVESTLIKNEVARTISNPFLMPDMLSEGRERLPM